MQEIQKNNDCPHLLFRGGYELLEKKLLDEKMKKRQHDALLTENPALIEDPPSPIQRHVKWKMARTNRYGKMTSKTARQIADKIGRHDILNTAIGRPDHGGRVRAAGEQVMKELEEEKKQSIQAWKKELKDAIIIDIFNGDKDSVPYNFDLNVLGARVSTKESNTEIVVNPSGEVHAGGVTPPMGLYVQSQNCTKLMALAKIHDGPSTIHCVAYTDDVVRVSVELVIDGEAEVPLPTSEVKYVRDAVNTFIAWPLPLVKLVSNEHSGITPDKVSNAAELSNDVPKQDLLRELIKTLVDIYDKPVEYMNEWSNGLGYRSVYGFLEPQSIHNAKDRRGQCEEYIEKWVKESQRQVCIGAYLNDAHWQMVVLCPKDNVVVWFCSVRRKSDVHIKTAINKLIPKTAPQWLELKWFGDGSALDSEVITTLRKKWAAYFLKLRTIQCRKL
ncbi:hypothetical protein HKD37_01G001978 [Glycine soja]